MFGRASIWRLMQEEAGGGGLANVLCHGNRAAGAMENLGVASARWSSFGS
jgi:hypothetical protein